MADRLEPGDPSQIAEFWLAGRLGTGGQGVVYDAYGPDGTRVAVKVLHGARESPQDLAQMAAEARAAQRVASFCTARIIQVRLEPPRPYIVSEYIDGQSLQAAVTGTGERAPRRFGADDLHRLGVGIATALTAIHQAKVVHRDLKPGNVMLGPDGPRLIDFGIARVLDTGSASQGGGLVGTLRYMPPEVYAGQRAGAEADVFAWGAIMVFAATGTHAFGGADLPQIAHRIRTSDPDLSALPDALRPLVGMALAKDPLERPSARSILAALTGDPREDAAGPQGLVAAGAAQAGPHTGWEPGDPALGKVAEDAYTVLSPDEQNLVPEVFLRCVVPGEDTSLSTRPVPAAELFDRQDPAEGEVLARVVRAFTPLLTVEPSTGGTAEQIVLARPAVLRAWPRLRNWVEHEREALAAHHSVRQAARVWDDNGRRGGDVLTGAYFDQAVGWATTGRRPSPNRIEHGLLDASTRAQTTRTRRIRTVAVVLAVTTLLSLAATGWAVRAQQSAAHQRDIASRQRDTAVSHQLVTQSERSNDPTVAALLAAAAWRIRETPESRTNLLDILAKPELAVLHTGVAYSVAFSPDGRTLATGSYRARVWDVGSRLQIGKPFTGAPDDPYNRVRSVAFSPDGGTLATADGGGIRLWDASTRRQIGKPLSSSASPAVFSPDGRILATSTTDGTVRLWDVAARRQIGEPLSGYELVFSPDGSTLATSADGTVRFWDVHTRRQIGAPLTGSGFVDSVAFSPDGHTLATVDENGVRLWDVAARRQIGKPFTDDTESVAFGPDGRVLATGGVDGTVRLWDVATRRQIGEPLTGHTDRVTSMDFSADGSVLATGSGDGTTRLWNMHARSLTGDPLPGDLASVAISPDGRVLATGGVDGTVRLWDVATRRQIGEPLTGHTGDVYSVVFGPDGRVLVTGGGDGTVRLWDVRTRRQIGEPLPEDDSGPVLSVAFGSDGRTLAVNRGGGGGTVRLWDTRTRRPISGVLFDRYVIVSVALSPDGRTLAVCTGSTVRFWDVRHGRLTGHPLTLPERSGSSGYASSMAFSPDGGILATGGEGAVRLWDAATRRQVGESLTGKIGRVTSMAFSPDGRSLATGGAGGAVRLWDLEARRQVGESLAGHTGRVTSVAFSPDGRTLVTATSGTSDEMTWLWDVSTPTDLVGSVCAAAGRGRRLAPREWAQYLPSGFEFQGACP
ncbi:WD40 repeat-containing protein [Mycobacterium tuberculosis]|nr:WD40 repeat-containing protein [Mycobacterium tuberculosis]